MTRRRFTEVEEGASEQLPRRRLCLPIGYVATEGEQEASSVGTLKRKGPNNLNMVSKIEARLYHALCLVGRIN